MNMANILIVDDDKIILEQLSKYVKNNFYKILLASNGKTALKIFDKEKIDILLIDVKLPDINGLDLLQKIKEKNRHCEVIITTGFGSLEVAIESLKKGAIDYIEKPVDLEELTTAIGRAIEKLLEKKELLYKNTILVIDDDNWVVQYLKQFLEKEGYKVFTANCGRDGVNILENNKVEVIITDILMEGMDGIEVLQKAKSLYNDIECIMITAHDDQNLAVKSLRAGAFDYIIKDGNLEKMLLSVEKAIEKVNLCRNRLYRNREQKITSEIISKLNEKLEKKIEERSQELNQTQTQLFQTSKLATLGEMSAGLAHEMNQPLGGIVLITKNLQKLMERGELTEEEIDKKLKDINECVRRMSKIIQHIRTFARQDTLKFISVDINKTIDSALSLLGEQLRLREIEIVKEFSDNLPDVTGEPYQIEQVWINLIANARDAVDEKQKKNKENLLYIKDYKKKIIINTIYNKKLKKVQMIISDNGMGMKEEVSTKAFEPFFTTKEVGKATGLGLAISYGIIESHKGKIEIESREGEGTSISVLL